MVDGWWTDGFHKLNRESLMDPNAASLSYLKEFELRSNYNVGEALCRAIFTDIGIFFVRFCKPNCAELFSPKLHF